MLADDLRAARALIANPDDWGKGGDDGQLPAGCFCAATAAGSATYSKEDRTDSYGRFCAVRDALNAQLPDRWRGLVTAVPNFNDDPSTTHADVLALFDRAIAAASPSHPKEPVL